MWMWSNSALESRLCLAGGVVEPEPEDQPKKTRGAGENEGHLPSLLVAEMDQAPGNEEGGDHGAKIRAAVEDAGGQGPFPLGEPLGHGLDGGGEIAGFADAEGAAHHNVHHHQPSDKGVEHAEHGPDDERKGQAELGADSIDDPAGQNGHAGVNAVKKEVRFAKSVLDQPNPPCSAGAQKNSFR